MEKVIIKKENPSNEIKVVYRAIGEKTGTTNTIANDMPSICGTDDWMKEMDRMLDAFSQQTTQSLRNIRKCFAKSGRLFNEEFKKHFLRESSERYLKIHLYFVDFI